MTAKEMFRKMKDSAEISLLRDEKIQCYISGTKNKRTSISKLIQKYKEDAELDYELGVITVEIYKHEIKIAELMNRNLEAYVVY